MRSIHHNYFSIGGGVQIGCISGHILMGEGLKPVGQNLGAPEPGRGASLPSSVW